MSSSIFKRRGTAVAAAVFAFVALVMIVAALLSGLWRTLNDKWEIRLRKEDLNILGCLKELASKILDSELGKEALKVNLKLASKIFEATLYF